MSFKMEHDPEVELVEPHEVEIETVSFEQMKHELSDVNLDDYDGMFLFNVISRLFLSINFLYV